MSYLQEEKKKQNIFRDCKLLLLLLLTAILFCLWGILKMRGEGKSLSFSLEEPYLAAVFTQEEEDYNMTRTENVGDDPSTFAGDDLAEEMGEVADEWEEAQIGDSETGGIESGESGGNPQDDVMTETVNTEDGKSQETKEAEEENADATDPGRRIREKHFEEIEAWVARSAYYDDGNQRALTMDYPFVQVDESYYADALFIGDSRIEGLHDYGGLDQATFAYKTGLSVFKILDETLTIHSVGNGTSKKGSLKDACQSGDYKKIFLMIGVNELAKGYAYQYVNKYIEVVEALREYAPDAVIEIMGIMYLTQAYSDGSEYFNNDNVNCRNAAMVAALPEDDAIIYLDMNECVADESGNALNPELTGDGLHLTAKNYYLWVDWLNAHGLQEDMFAAAE